MFAVAYPGRSRHPELTPSHGDLGTLNRPGIRRCLKHYIAREFYAPSNQDLTANRSVLSKGWSSHRSQSLSDRLPRDLGEVDGGIVVVARKLELAPVAKGFQHASPYHGNLVAHPQGREPVGDHHDRDRALAPLKVVIHHVLVVEIERARGSI